jgi:2-polyprenyl-6-methoxyphenol hydroxylase-like FAD-dependent oxidoreductase
MNRQQPSPIGNHAIVIGGSIAGLMTARVLSDHFARVTLVERDPLHDQPEARKGQPQARHVHGLLAKGLAVMSEYFPDLPEGLCEAGAYLGDIGQQLRWYSRGGYRVQFQSGLMGALMSRPLLEWQIRRRVLALPNVTVCDGAAVEGLLATADHSRIQGVQICRRGANHQPTSLLAELVVDACGRGSATPKWLAALGYGQPPESEVKAEVAYATRIFRRRPGDLPGAAVVLIDPGAPSYRRGGALFAAEGERWICSLAARGGEAAPASAEEFVEFARTLAAPDIYQVIRQAEPLSDICYYHFSANRRRHYEQMARWPGGLLVLGDAVCSFNPIYGQGMTSAVLQAQALDRLLATQGLTDALAFAFFRQVARVIETPWQLAIAEDRNLSKQQQGARRGKSLLSRYLAQFYSTLHHDPVVYGEFLRVINLMQPPATLFHPRVLWRVARHALSGQHSPVSRRLLTAHR